MRSGTFSNSARFPLFCARESEGYAAQASRAPGAGLAPLTPKRYLLPSFTSCPTSLLLRQHQRQDRRDRGSIDRHLRPALRILLRQLDRIEDHAEDSQLLLRLVLELRALLVATRARDLPGRLRGCGVLAHKRGREMDLVGRAHLQRQGLQVITLVSPVCLRPACISGNSAGLRRTSSVCLSVSGRPAAPPATARAGIETSRGCEQFGTTPSRIPVDRADGPRFRRIIRDSTGCNASDFSEPFAARTKWFGREDAAK